MRGGSAALQLDPLETQMVTDLFRLIDDDGNQRLQKEEISEVAALSNLTI